MTILRWLARFFGFLLAVLFIVTAVLSLALVNIESNAFNSETYKRALVDQGLYSRVPEVMAVTVMDNLPKIGFGPGTTVGQLMLDYMTARDWQTLITTLLPPQDIQQMTESTLDQFFDYINGKQNTISVPLTPIKQNLGIHGTDAVLQVLSVQPTCSTNQILAMSTSILAGQNPFADSGLLCNPPPDVIALIKPAIDQVVQQEADILPDTFPLDGPSADTLQKLEILRLAMRLSPIVPLILLFLMTLLLVRSFNDWFLGWGVTLLPVGLLGAGLYYLGIPLFRAFFASLVLDQIGTQLPTVTSDFLRDLLSGVASNLLGGMGPEALLLSLIGLVMIVIRGLLKPKAPSR